MSSSWTAEERAFLAQAFDAARAGRTGQLREWITAGLSVNLTNTAGDTLLLLAAYHDHPATVAALVALGADLDRVNDNGQTALAAAVFRRSEPSVTTLLRAGADPHRGERSAMAIATFFDLSDMATLLAENLSNRSEDPL